MTTEKLVAILRRLIKVDAKLELQHSLTQIKDALTSLATSPASTQHQTALGNALSAFSSGAAQLESQFTPSELSLIAELGGTEFFEARIAEDVRTAVERNAMTPLVAATFVRELTSRRETFLNNVVVTLAGLDDLLQSDANTEGSSVGDVSFVVPRALFANELGSFAKELSFINLLVEHLQEATSGDVSPIELKALSSSVPTIAIASSLTTMLVLGQVVNSFLDAWGKIQKARTIREELKELGMGEVAADQLSEEITSKVEEVVTASVRLTLRDAPNSAERRNELENALAIDFRRLFGQIERGLVVEIKTHPSDFMTDDEKLQSETLRETVRKMKFPPLSDQPLLLNPGEILEGEITRKKTTTTKTSRMKSGLRRDRETQ